MPSLKRKAEAGASPLDVLMIILAFAGGIVLATYYKNEKLKRTVVTYEKQLALAKVGKCDESKQDEEVILNDDSEEQMEETEETPSDAEKKTELKSDPVLKAVEFNLEKAATPRIVGNPDAPLKISEHSSFTCGGCAAFHANNYKEIKRNYIDTGKAYLVFDDFPRNQVDIIVGAAARCVPEEAYFNFTQLLFETQKQWVGKDNFVDYIKQNAKFAGADASQIDACLNSDELKETLADRQNKAYREHGVQSTPTLVLNDGPTISGLAPYDQIKAAFDKAIQEATQ